MKKHSSMALVVFAVCMVSYSGPMVKGALNEGASPISVALLRMLAAALLTDLSPVIFVAAAAALGIVIHREFTGGT